MCGLASNRRLKAVPNTQLKVGLLGFDRGLEMYCRLSCRRRSSSSNSHASTWRLETGDVLNAPRQVRNAALCTRSSDWRTDFRAEPYTTQPESNFERTWERYNFSKVAQFAPQFLWAITRNRFSALKHLSFKYLMCCLKVSFLSKSRPRNLNSLTTGIGTPYNFR